MLQNGTVINNVQIDKPHRLITATTIATQIITAVTSSSYGGATINLTHLAPFVRDSYDRYIKKYRERGHSEEDCIKYAKEDIKKEVSDSVQTFNYQCNSMTNTNGQSPFLSVFMYLNDTEEYKEELAMLIEEFIRQGRQLCKTKIRYYCGTGRRDHRTCHGTCPKTWGIHDRGFPCVASDKGNIPGCGCDKAASH